MLTEAVLKDFGNVQAGLGSYGIEIYEICVGDDNRFYGGSAIVSLHRIEECANGFILVLVRPTIRETLVRLSQRETLFETTTH